MGPDAADHGETIDNIDHLLSLLDVSNATTTTAFTTDVAQQVDELRGLVEKGKQSLLIELLHGGHAKELRKAELVDAGLRLRDALAAHDERRALQTLYKDVKSLQHRVATSESNYKMLSDKVAAGRMEFESANANANSIRADVSRLGGELSSAKLEASVTKAIANSVSAKVDWLEESVAQGRKETESAYGLSLFLGFCGAAAGALWAFL